MPETITPRVIAVCDAVSRNCVSSSPSASIFVAQPEAGLVGPHGVAGLQLRCKTRLLASATSPWVISREHESNNKNMVHIPGMCWKMRGRQQKREKTLRDSLREATQNRIEKIV